MARVDRSPGWGDELQAKRPKLEDKFWGLRIMQAQTKEPDCEEENTSNEGMLEDKPAAPPCEEDGATPGPTNEQEAGKAINTILEKVEHEEVSALSDVSRPGAAGRHLKVEIRTVHRIPTLELLVQRMTAQRQIFHGAKIHSEYLWAIIPGNHHKV